MKEKDRSSSSSSSSSSASSSSAGESASGSGSDKLEQLEPLKPADIKKSQKKATQTFIAMLEEKKNKAKMIPIQIMSKFETLETEEPETSASKKKPEFVSTFKVIDEVGKTDSEDKKMTAKELLERVKRKREKEGGGNEGPKPKDKEKESKSVVPSKVALGRIAKSKKILPRPSRPNKKQTADLDSDYAWYQQYYVNTYNLDAYTAAYSAYYAMVTGGDYNQDELNVWMKQQGYSEAMFYNVHEKPMETIVSQLLQPSEVAIAEEISVLVANIPEDVNAVSIY